MPETPDQIAEIKKLRDEAALKIHLASMDLQSQWSDLERRWEAFQEKAALGTTARGVARSLKEVGEELKTGYVRLRAAL